MDTVSTTFQGRLMPGERTRWTGRPTQQLLLFSSADLFIIPFSLFWLGFVGFWTYSASQSPSMGPAVLFSLIFWAVGIYLLVGRFFVDWWIRRSISYAVTDRRVLILREGTFGSFTALDIDQIEQVRIAENADGTGTIKFGPDVPVYGRRGRQTAPMSPALDPTPQFIAIDKARIVFDMIQREQAKE